MSDTVQYPQYSAEGLPLTYVPNPFAADGKPADGQWKMPVRVHTIGPITLSGLQTIDGVALMEGDRVLVKDQILPEQNGIYVASAYTWNRALDCYLWEQFPAAVVGVQEGLTVGDTVFICDAAGTGTVGVTANYWVSVSETAGTLPSFTPLRALVSDPLGAPTASPTTSQEIAFLSGVTQPVQSSLAFLNNQGASAFTIAVSGTNAAATAQSAANAAQSTANTALSTGNSAYALAQTGTNAAATAQSTANSAYALAVTGTTVGSLAYSLATQLGGKYVRTTRFYSVGAGTAGAVTLPTNAVVVLDDFGGATDAVVATISSGKPTFQHAFTSAGAIVTTTFDAAGNYSLSGVPSAYPVAVVYRVRQKLTDFDGTSADIVGEYDLEEMLGYNVSVVSAGTTLVPASPALRAYFVDTSAGPAVIGLPNTSGWNGESIHIKKVSADGNTVTVRSVTGTQPVDLSTQQVFSAPLTSIQVMPSGTNWYII